MDLITGLPTSKGFNAILTIVEHGATCGETALADVVPFLTLSDEHRMLIVYYPSSPGIRYCPQSS
jgi:hypothetical protein